MPSRLIPTNRRPTSAGEMLVEEFLKPLSISQAEFAQRIGVTYHRLNEIVNGRRGISVDTALRFSKALGTTPNFWLNLQQVSDMYNAQHSPAAREIERIRPVTEPFAVRVSVRVAKKAKSKRTAKSIA